MLNVVLASHEIDCKGCIKCTSHNIKCSFVLHITSQDILISFWVFLLLEFVYSTCVRELLKKVALAQNPRDPKIDQF